MFAVVMLAKPVYAQTAARIVLQVDNPVMYVDGVGRPIDGRETTPKIVDGRVVAPVRPVVDAIGGSLLWDSDLLLLTIRDYLEENEIILKINSLDSVVNARTGPQLYVAPVLLDDMTLVPIVFVARNLGFEVEWDDATRTMIITKETESE